jgi:hypothetical protein
VEVKPKAGLLPTSRHIAREHAVKLRVPRFALHQLLKHLKVWAARPHSSALARQPS